MVTACKHPKVRIVSRLEDTEFVECLECGDVFDSEEFHDMEIEESVEKDEPESDDAERRRKRFYGYMQSGRL